MNVTVQVKPEELPYGDHGLPGSILDIALKHGIEPITRARRLRCSDLPRGRSPGHGQLQ